MSSMSDSVRKFVSSLIIVLSVSVFAQSIKAADNAIINPWVVTDASVNCFDYQNLVKDLTEGLSDPQDQAIALFSFFRRAMFPYTARVEYPFPVNDQQHMFDFLRMVNVYGYALCTQNNWMFASFCRQSGLFEDARGISVPGHGTCEVKWNGRWHFMDPIVGCYALRRDNGEIASIDDIVADTTLLTRAVAEKRASMPFCPWDGEQIYPEGALAKADQWFSYRRYGLNFLLGALPEYEAAEVNEPCTHTMAFSLRPGFRLVRMWNNLPGMYNLSYDYHRKQKDRLSPSPAILPPHHPDRCQEKLDEKNWPVIKPYRKVINGRDSYHYYANGILFYEDDFTDRRFFQAADSVKALEIIRDNDLGTNVLSVAGRDCEGEAFLTFEAPYVFVGGKVAGRARVAEGSWLAVYMDIGGGENRPCIGVVESSGDFSFGLPKALIDQRYGFGISLKLHGGHRASVILLELRAEAVCQLNMYSLPFLKPGRNKVTVNAEIIPENQRMAITYRWQEKGWDRTHCQIINKSGESYFIEAAGEDYPKMREIVMENIYEEF